MSQLHFETNRLLIRTPEISDANVITKHLSNPNISRTTLTIPFPYHEPDAKDRIAKAQHELLTKAAYTFVIIIKETGELIGAIGLHMYPLHDRAEAGYWVAESYWNQGFCTEALTGILVFGFEELGLNKIYATHIDGNDSSGRVMQKTGMTYEGKLHKHYKKNGSYIDVVQYAILKS